MVLFTSRIAKAIFLIFLAYHLTFTVFLVLRVDGIDVDNYQALFEEPFAAGWDFGFSMIIFILSKVTNFPFFLLTIFLIQMIFYFCFCKKFDLSFPLFFAVYLLHLVVVRDFAQFRVGLAIAVFVTAFYSSKKLSIAAVLSAGLIHITSLYLLPILIFHKLNLEGFKRILLIFGICLVPFVLSNSLDFLSNYNERIYLYLNWTADGYGVKVSGYSILIFICLLVISFFFRSRLGILHQHPMLPAYGLSFVYAGLTYISFSDLSIFASRLANVALSLYPFYVASLLDSYSRCRHLTNRVLVATFGLSILVALVLRSGSPYIIDAIQPYML